ncbi:hypothetical protein G7Y79_00020g048180 [Physcia stellaris]|nr:hypothetical protein G7Y79_00020g048180 [Physcia stellaris]
MLKLRFRHEAYVERRNIEQKIADPLRYGWPGRKPCTRFMSDERPEVDAVIKNAIADRIPVTVIDRFRYLLYHGFYTFDELRRHPPFAAVIVPSPRHWIEWPGDSVNH